MSDEIEKTEESEETEITDNKEKVDEKYIGDGRGYGVGAGIGTGVRASQYHCATSFEELEQIEEARELSMDVDKLALSVPAMVDNIMSTPYETEKLSMLQRVGEGFKNAVTKLFSGSEDDDDMKDNEKQNTFIVYKDKDGRYLWLTAYSNNVRDNDVPPEIISSKSHEKFVEMVDSGKEELPELWLWHEQDWRIGKATTVAYDKDSGFALAAGYFYKEAESIANAIENSDVLWGVSHGMPVKQIKRSSKDSTIIIEHVTKEISPLPWDAAANKLASFTILKEDNMPVPKNKRQEVLDLGIPEDALMNLEEQNKAKSQLADQLELERKEEQQEGEQPEVETPELSDEPETKETIEETPAEPEETVEDDTKEEPEVPFTESQVSAIKQFTDGMLEILSKEIDEMFEEKLAPVLETLEKREKSVDELVKETISNTPVASLHDLLGGVSLRKMSATEDEDTKVDGRTQMARSKPKEAAEEAETLVGSVVGGILSGGYRNGYRE